MKPGEYIGSDGRAHNVRSVMLDELHDACNSATMQLNGGAWLTYKKHLLPSHPDFPAAVAALQALIQPKQAVPFAGVHPGVGLRWCGEEEHGEEFVYLSDDWRMRFYDRADHFCGPWDLERRMRDDWHVGVEPGPSIALLAFEAGRRYEREGG